MASEVEICNLALSNIRAGSINSLTEASTAAQNCKLKYPILRDRCLADNAWGFNHKLVAMQLLTTEVYNWAYAYKYPVDCLKINRLVGAQEELLNSDADVISRLIDSNLLPVNDIRRKIPYEVFNYSDNKLIGTNDADLYIDYVVKVEDPNLFTPDFTLALSHLLASEVAIPIVGVELGRQLRSDELQIYEAYLASAISSDMNEQQMDTPESEFVTVRR